jgi:hypothetical protein
MRQSSYEEEVRVRVSVSSAFLVMSVQQNYLTGVEILDKAQKLFSFLVLYQRLWVDMTFFHKPCSEFL